MPNDDPKADITLTDELDPATLECGLVVAALLRPLVDGQAGWTRVRNRNQRLLRPLWLG
jgi:hypothetical protein